MAWIAGTAVLLLAGIGVVEFILEALEDDENWKDRGNRGIDDPEL